MKSVSDVRMKDKVDHLAQRNIFIILNEDNHTQQYKSTSTKSCLFNYTI